MQEKHINFEMHEKKGVKETRTHINSKRKSLSEEFYGCYVEIISQRFFIKLRR